MMSAAALIDVETKADPSLGSVALAVGVISVHILGSGAADAHVVESPLGSVAPASRLGATAEVLS